MDAETRNGRLLNKACPDRAERDRLEKLLNGMDLDEWFETVDESAYALEDWIEAVLFFDSWLERVGCARRPVPAMIGYIHCCTLTLAETLSPPSLKDLVKENLERYGFDTVKSNP